MLSLFKRLFSMLFVDLFAGKKSATLGIYGPPNGGKTTLANRICKDVLGEEAEMGSVSKIAHETRAVHVKERVTLKRKGKSLSFTLVDTPGIATKIDYEEFVSEGLTDAEAKQRAKEATQGVIDAIKWLDDVDAVIVVVDATKDPYTQVNITIIGNLEARKIPVLLVANKMDLKKAELKQIQAAFPKYEVLGISAKTGEGIEEFYTRLLKMRRQLRRH